VYERIVSQVRPLSLSSSLFPVHYCTLYSTVQPQTTSQRNAHERPLFQQVTQGHGSVSLNFCEQWSAWKEPTEVAHLSTVNIYIASRQTSWPFLRQFDANLSNWTAERVKQWNAEGAVLFWNTYCAEQEKWNNPEDESEMSKINYCVGKWSEVKITNWINY
jgi:hypothetical protein